MLLVALAALTLRAAQDAAVARRLDRAGNCGGRILTGWELALGRYGVSGRHPTPLSAGLAGMAVDDAAALAGRVARGQGCSPSTAAPFAGDARSAWSRRGRAGGWLAGSGLDPMEPLLAAVRRCPAFLAERVRGRPRRRQGALRQRTGNPRHRAAAAPVDQLELVLESARGQEPPLPMFPEPDGAWRAVLAKVVEPADYFVRAYRARSQKYHIERDHRAADREARLRIVPPEYANRAPYEGPLPKEGVSGLAGTKVEVFLRSNRPLGGGTIALWGNNPGSAPAGGTPQRNAAGGTPAPQSGRPAPQSATPAPQSTTPAQQNEPAMLSMRPAEAGSQEVVGQFTIAGDGKFECRVIDQDGQASQQSFSGNITMLRDERPFIRLTQPPKMSLATPSAALPVALSAEDDCGISRLQLFRSLNDSRPLPVDLPLPSRPPRRLDESVHLPLAAIWIAARRRDQALRPRGGQRSGRRQRGGEHRGHRAHRQPGGVRADVPHAAGDASDACRSTIRHGGAWNRWPRRSTSLQKKLEKLPPDDKASEEMRRELQRLRESMRREAEEIRKAAEHPLPYDLDQVSHAAVDRSGGDERKGWPSELEKLLEERDLLNKKLGGKLDELAKRLSAGRQQFNETGRQTAGVLRGRVPLVGRPRAIHHAGPVAAGLLPSGWRR